VDKEKNSDRKCGTVQVSSIQ